MVFECFRDGKCEWEKGLRSFAGQYNRKFHKNYELSECLDVKYRQSPQPEVLLKADGEPSIVVECKKIVYPEDYFENHRKWHTFYDCFSQAFNRSLRDLLPEARYVIEIDPSIYDFKISQIATDVVEPIRRHIEQAARSSLHYRRVSNNLPIPWAFRQLASYECEEGEIGIGVRVVLWTSPWLSLQNIEQAERHISRKLETFLGKASEKFVDYESCIKILVVELCGDTWAIPSSSSFEKICTQVALPELVDQIWLAEPTISEVNEEIDYYRVR